ncbi:hypothetical protein [Sanguibacter sp. HDW7]|uniref:hypothetical protein n=1 Tax=Sanguibacter sp. HDW7 TaxID=2714931 RepID=UPI00140A5BE8|nr:hypothetical protein [Sanguibacter sp. HDW7]QIK83169.1 hypothetical protein G7063_05640 [Sanguibacter sp. HDW7]
MTTLVRPRISGPQRVDVGAGSWGVPATADTVTREGATYVRCADGTVHVLVFRGQRVREVLLAPGLSAGVQRRAFPMPD